MREPAPAKSCTGIAPYDAVPVPSPPAKASSPFGSVQQGPGMPDQRLLGMAASPPASPASTVSER
eukprot:3387661-Alexandrium_andersonii.AAC.1